MHRWSSKCTRSVTRTQESSERKNIAASAICKWCVHLQHMKEFTGTNTATLYTTGKTHSVHADMMYHLSTKLSTEKREKPQPPSLKILLHTRHYLNPHTYTCERHKQTNIPKCLVPAPPPAADVLYGCKFSAVKLPRFGPTGCGSRRTIPPTAADTELDILQLESSSR